MKGRIFALLLFLCSLFLAVGGDAQSTDTTDKPVWTLEFIKVSPARFGLAMTYLDDHWMRVRAEAKRQGAILDYHRIQNTVLLAPGHKVGDPNSIVLLTEYKNMAAFLESEKLLASISEHLPEIPGVIRPSDGKGLFETVDTRVFVEEPETNAQLRLLARQ